MNTFGRTERNTRRNIPVEQGKEYQVTVEDVGRGGDGIARLDGFVIFVPNATKGETINIKVTSVKEKFAFAERI
ncbi:MAG: hypothetical protein PWP15_1152 [Methanothermococcus sp.]|jgi:predicted RNA-binding protein with TRAM domain|uniref:TRAM domain-containing protein n=1 Tax=Methanothermococcus TaxID=155862 RepID=UPI00036E6DB9|nr:MULTISPECIES: TRAM domain-containing protein [Methanothermococcus]MDK2790645.1 hypothetical protein [Methanothermococcus sp.]MDK2987598.1 hypothetical protein [Methanothermococcus sp.]